ncbi:MAG: OmpA family protein [Rhodospirillales bacterium]
MALLFALFMLLLSFADVDSESFNQNAGPMRDAFLSGEKVLMTTPQQTAQVGQAGPGRNKAKPQPRLSPTAGIVQFDNQQKAKRSFLWQFRRTMERELASSRILLIDKGDRIVIRFPGATSFVPGGAELADDFSPALLRIASILRATQGQILVSGHTDNLPISTARFRSNRDLSTARAVTVVHFLMEKAAVKPSRITVSGFADSRPLVKNNSLVNRVKNRRVEIALQLSDFEG